MLAETAAEVCRTGKNEGGLPEEESAMTVHLFNRARVRLYAQEHKIMSICIIRGRRGVEGLILDPEKAIQLNNQSGANWAKPKRLHLSGKRKLR